MLAEMMDEDSEEEEDADDEDDEDWNEDDNMEDVESGNVLEIALVDAVSDSTGNGDMGVLNFLGARVEA